KSELLERPFNPDVLGLDRKALAPERLGDLIGVHGAVEMTLGIGVGLDCQRALGDLRGQALEVGSMSFLKVFESLAVLLDHAEIVLSREGRQPLRNQIVSSKSRPHLDDITGLAELGDRLCQDQLNMPMLGATRMVLASFDAGLSWGLLSSFLHGGRP